MSALSVVAALGVFGLVVGMILVNMAVTPRAAEGGTILAGIGVFLLAVAAVGHLLT
jgi:hypothetical protein